MAMTLEHEREAFEAAVRQWPTYNAYTPMTWRDESGRYGNPVVQGAWLAWQSRAHLTQPAQAVDVGALQKVASDLACVARLTDHDLTRGTCQSASERITRALSAEKAGPDGWHFVQRGDRWTVANPCCGLSVFLENPVLHTWSCDKAIRQHLPASPTDGEE